tara:strand:- start:103 stop:279 length:177 start_codon:yes stop_codon:yes gene_type:complete
MRRSPVCKHYRVDDETLGLITNEIKHIARVIALSWISNFTLFVFMEHFRLTNQSSYDL